MPRSWILEAATGLWALNLMVSCADGRYRIGVEEMPAPGTDEPSTEPEPPHSTVVPRPPRAATPSRVSEDMPDAPGIPPSPEDMATPDEPPTDGPVVGPGENDDVSVTVALIEPTETATVRLLPELQLLELAPVGEDVQSTFFKTTEVNREFRRGVMEFAIPPLERRHLLSAKLVLTPGGGTTASPLPTDDHRLLSYAGDGIVDATDYAAPAVEVTVFEMNVDYEYPPADLSFDVTGSVDAQRGRFVAFRVELGIPDTFAEDVGFGMAFYEPQLLLTHEAQ